jgi:RNA polymerase sigma-70 factor (ECF subfamily)
VTGGRIVNRSRQLDLHAALVNGNPAAPDELVRLLLAPLKAGLHKRFRGASSEEAYDAVADALIALIRSPLDYDPSSGSLTNYLLGCAGNRLVDAWRSKAQAKRAEVYVGGSSELEDIQATGWGGARPRSVFLSHTLYPDETERVADYVLSFILPNQRDQRLFAYLLDGRCKTTDVASLMGISERPLAEQRTLIKRHKDRIWKRIERTREELYELFEYTGASGGTG